MTRLAYLAALWLMFPFGSAVYANVAMPGLFLAGAGRTPTNAEGELGFAAEHIEMVRELVVVQLYSGCAVVRGQYWFYNSHPNSISVIAGFPVDAFAQNVSRRGQSANPIYVPYDDLYSIKVYVNGQPITSPPMNLGVSGSARVDTSSWLGRTDWRIWPQTLLGNDTTLVTVYYVVNTAEAAYRRGYSSTNFPAFGYVVESGSVWAGNIQEARTAVQLIEGQTVDNLMAVYPENQNMRASSDGRILSYVFFNREPSAADNLVLALNQASGARLDSTAAAYAALDQFAATLPAHEALPQVYEAEWYIPGKGLNIFLWCIAGFFTMVVGLIIRQQVLSKRRQVLRTAAAPPPHTPPPAGGDHPA